MSTAPWASETLGTVDGLARRKCDTFTPTRPQLDFLSCTLIAALWLDGNQCGKTVGLLLDHIFRCRGHHPFQVLRHKPPISTMIMGVSHEQLGKPGGTMEKLYDLLPKDEIEDVTFAKGKGFGGKPPAILFRNGSVISFGTFAQDPQVLAGPTMHHISSDEPIPQSHLSELLPRLIRLGGTIRMVFTPTPDMPPQVHLRELCEKADETTGRPPIKLFNFGLTAENTRPIGAPFPLMSQRAIDQFERMLPAAVRPMRIRGNWDPVITDRWVTAWDATVHASMATWEDPPADAVLVMSGDHGIQPGKQAAVLSAYADVGGLHPRAWFLGSVRRHGRTNQKQDAAAILELLASWGWDASMVDRWVFDRSAQDRDAIHRKDNDRLCAHLAEQAGVPFELLKARFDIPTKFKGSVYSGIGLFNAMCADRLPPREPGGPERPCVMVHPVHAAEFARAVETYKGGPRDPAKDMFDAGRYGLEEAVEYHPATVRFIGRH